MNIWYIIGQLFTIFVFLMCGALASPLFDFFFGNTKRGGYRNGYRRPKSGSNSGGYSDYRKICSVVNPHPYAFPSGSNSYPSVPVCPY